MLASFFYSFYTFYLRGWWIIEIKIKLKYSQFIWDKKSWIITLNWRRFVKIYHTKLILRRKRKKIKLNFWKWNSFFFFFLFFLLYFSTLFLFWSHCNTLSNSKLSPCLWVTVAQLLSFLIIVLMIQDFH